MAKTHQFAGYEVLSTLGKGAASTIYAVRDPDNSLYALKRVVRNGPEDQRFLDQAEQEHRVASKLDHPLLRKSFRLIKQRSLFRTSELLVVMELVDGRTLERFRNEPMPRLVRICSLVAEGLESMHDNGFVHADVKPNNIIVTRDPDLSVKLIDFGQSCPAGTVKQRIQGTPDYIAPEQVRREAITAQTDIFNLGATMYWLVTGSHVETLVSKNQKKKPGTPASNGMGRAKGPKKDSRRPIKVNADVPPALSSLIMSCVAEDRLERPTGMREVLERLEIAGDQALRKATEKSDLRAAC